MNDILVKIKSVGKTIQKIGRIVIYIGNCVRDIPMDEDDDKDVESDTHK